MQNKINKQNCTINDLRSKGLKKDLEIFNLKNKRKTQISDFESMKKSYLNQLEQKDAEILDLFQKNSKLNLNLKDSRNIIENLRKLHRENKLFNLDNNSQEKTNLSKSPKTLMKKSDPKIEDRIQNIQNFNLLEDSFNKHRDQENISDLSKQERNEEIFQLKEVISKATQTQRFGSRKFKRRKKKKRRGNKYFKQ